VLESEVVCNLCRPVCSRCLLGTLPVCPPQPTLPLRDCPGNPPSYNHAIKHTTQAPTHPPLTHAASPGTPTLHLGYEDVSCPLSSPPSDGYCRFSRHFPSDPPLLGSGGSRNVQRGEGRGTKAGANLSLVRTDKGSVKASA
jgi:hypothetical protein